MDVEILLALMATLLFWGVNSATFTVKNNCPYTIWPALQTGTGSQPSTTGFELPSQNEQTVDVPAPWSGRMWARFVCSNIGGNFTCLSGDCGTGQIPCGGAGGSRPATLVEFTLAVGGGQDFYDVSLVDGFNLPVLVVPQGGAADCNRTSCPVDINAVCLPALSIKNTDGGTIGCKSACTAFHEPRYCCTGAYSAPGKCPPSTYSQFFKTKCPLAYSYAFDNQNSLFTCSGGPSYFITFCP